MSNLLAETFTSSVRLPIALIKTGQSITGAYGEASASAGSAAELL